MPKLGKGEIMDTFMIKRFYAPNSMGFPSKPTEVIKTDLTLEEAQEHCGDPSTEGAGWFDGFEKE